MAYKKDLALHEYTNERGAVKVFWSAEDEEVMVEATVKDGTGLTYRQEAVLDPDEQATLRPIEDLIEQAYADIEKEEINYRYLENPPRWKVVALDVTPHCDKDWLEEFKLDKVEEIWLYNDARRVHICSMTGSIEAHYVSQRCVIERLYEDGLEPGEESELELLRDQAENELNPPDSYIDYFGSLTGPTHAFAEEDDDENMRRLVREGEDFYQDEYVDAYLEACSTTEYV